MLGQFCKTMWRLPSHQSVEGVGGICIKAEKKYGWMAPSASIKKSTTVLIELGIAGHANLVVAVISFLESS